MRRNVAYNWILQNILFPASNLLIGRKFWSLYRSLQKTQWYSRKEIENIQLSRLKGLVTHAYATVPLYRELFDRAGVRPDNIGTLSDIQKLPIVTKNDFRDGFPQRCTSSAVSRQRWLPDSTSGSTGRPFQFIRDPEFSDASLANTFRTYTWTGMEMGDRNFSLWGYHDTPLSVKILNTLIRKTMLSSFDVDRLFREYYRILQSARPMMLEAYSASVTQFASLLSQNSLLDLDIPITISSAETLYPHHKEIIEKTLHTSVYNRYGSRECGCVAQECQKHEGLHINAESYIVEVVNNGEKDGRGRIVITNLTNYAMPFIRYDTEDVGVMGTESCSCGRGLPVLKSVEGRATDFVRLPNGNDLSFLFFNYFFEQYGAYLTQFQVVQDARDHLTLNLVVTGRYNDDKERELREGIMKQTDNSVTLTINKVAEIPREASGKYRPVKRLV